MLSDQAAPWLMRSGLAVLLVAAMITTGLSLSSTTSVARSAGCLSPRPYGSPISTRNRSTWLHMAEDGEGKGRRKRRIKGKASTTTQVDRPVSSSSLVSEPTPAPLSSSSSPSLSAPTEDSQAAPNLLDLVRNSLAKEGDPSSSISSSSSSSSYSSLPTSRLPPLVGTAEAMQQEYLGGKSGLEKSLEELFAPTPAGQEPKLAKLAKQVTWVAVLVLVMIEIVVSVKTGGMPFDMGKVSLPSLPSLPFLTPSVPAPAQVQP